MQPTMDPPGFSNIQQAPPTVAQPATSSANRFGFVKNYLLSVPGIIKILLVIFQFACWVSAAAVLKPPASISNLPDDFAATRGAIIFFSLVGFFLAILFFVLHLLNIVNLKVLNRVPWILIQMIIDFVWLIPTFVLAIVASVKEGALRDPYFLYGAAVNTGAFGSAAFFGFLNTILYAIDGGFHLLLVIRSGPMAPPPYTP